MRSEFRNLKIRGVDLLNRSIITVHLTNDRTFLVPLDKFPTIKKLSPNQKQDFEIIDDSLLSFVAIDDVYSIGDLLGI